MIVVQAEERNMYDQHFVSDVLREKYPFLNSYIIFNTNRKTFILFPYSRADTFICIISLICAIKCDIKGYQGMLLSVLCKENC